MSPGRLHLQRVIEAVEVVEQPDGGTELDNLALIKISPQFVEKPVVHLIGIKRQTVGKPQCSLVRWREVCTLLKIGEVLNLVFGPAMPPCQGGVRGKSILAVVELRRPQNDEFLEFGGHCSGIHDRPKMRNHSAENLRTMSHGAEHVGHVPPLFQVAVENLSSCWIDLFFA